MRRVQMLLALAAVAAVTASVLVVRATPTLVPLTGRVLVTPDHRMSEFMVDVSPTNPRHLVMGGIDWDDPVGGIGCGIWTSFDGGRTWSRADDPPGLDVPHTRADPWVAFAPNGDVHMSCLHLPGAITGSLTPKLNGLDRYLRLVHARSTDGGRTWGRAENVPALTPRNQRDKEAVFVTRSGRVLICTNDYSLVRNTLSVYRSDDGGASWLPPVVVQNIQGDQLPGGNCNGFGQAPDGTVYFVGYSAGTQGASLDMDVFVSRDNGDSWRPVKLEGLTFPTDVNWTAEALTIYPKGTWPSIAVDPTDGDVVVSSMIWDYERGRFWSRLYRSTDDGATFQPMAAPVPPTALCTGCHLASPLVAFDAQGRLGLQMMLFSNDGGMTREQWLHVSSDDGSTWLQPLLFARTDGAQENWTNPWTWAPRNAQATVEEDLWLLEHPMDADGISSNWGARTQGGTTHHLRLGGDYWDLAATDEGFVVMWNDHKNGYSQIWASLIAVS
ncbi:MAG: sialidase family protein [Actinomycetota bacterium]